MVALIRRPTKTTPFVHLDLETDTYIIAGRSIPIDAELFYRPLLNWFEELERHDVGSIRLCLRFDFFNIASSKRILFILYRLAEFQKQGIRVSVRWMYEKSDEDMLEIGQDYAVMIDSLDFDFEAYEVDETKESHYLKMG